MGDGISHSMLVCIEIDNICQGMSSSLELPETLGHNVAVLAASQPNGTPLPGNHPIYRKCEAVEICTIPGLLTKNNPSADLAHL
jgi:hypothetical protein